MTGYNVLLYYYFVRIDNPENFATDQRTLCDALGLRGRILVSYEGINGTVSGTIAQCDAYMHALRSDERFTNIEFKIDVVDNHVFSKMFVRVKKELVTLRDDKGPAERERGKYVEPDEFVKLLQQDDVIVLDGRTDYEYDLGHFRGAIRPPVSSFRAFPEWIRKEFGTSKHKKFITYCTGGVRCEKLTSFMISEGFEDVAQLHGGIVRYGKDESTLGSLWDGRCYVFDERISVEINRAGNKRVIGKCFHCSSPTEHYTNCANLDCHRQHLVCSDCEKRMQRSCSEECRHAPRREFVSS